MSKQVDSIGRGTMSIAALALVVAFVGACGGSDSPAGTTQDPSPTVGSHWLSAGIEVAGGYLTPTSFGVGIISSSTILEDEMLLDGVRVGHTTYASPSNAGIHSVDRSFTTGGTHHVIYRILAQTSSTASYVVFSCSGSAGNALGDVRIGASCPQLRQNITLRVGDKIEFDVIVP